MNLVTQPGLTRVNADMQLEVVFSLEKLLAYLAPELPTNAMGREVPPEIALTGENLKTRN